MEVEARGSWVEVEAMGMPLEVEARGSWVEVEARGSWVEARDTSGIEPIITRITIDKWCRPINS